MPLHVYGLDLLRINLERIRDGLKVYAVSIGSLTSTQLAAINASRQMQQLAPILAEVLFVGGHIYESRIVRDGYKIEDVLDQISSAMKEAAIVLDATHMTAMQNPNWRADRYGNFVKDRAVFECSVRHPRPEIFSIVPKGDRIKPTK